MCDIGGGSAELLSANNGELAFATSFKIGAIRMSEKYFPNEDVNQLQVEDCKEFIRNEIFLAAETIKIMALKSLLEQVVLFKLLLQWCLQCVVKNSR